ncbi:MAG: sensor histidine kinase [Nitrospiraceae bacterium]|nr:MAG: sensor histidine kinase [Nitrospiraceae bacterium]
MNNKEPEYYRALKLKLIVITLIVALVPLAILSWRASLNYQRQYKENITSEIQRIARNRSDVINFFLEEQRSLISIIIKLYGFQHLKEQKNLDVIFSAVQKKTALVDIGVLNERGKHEAYAGPYKNIVFDKNYYEEKWFKEVMFNGSYTSDVYLGYRNVPHFVVAMADQDREWAIRATIDSEIFNSLLKSSWIGESGDAFIVNSSGVMQTRPRSGNSGLTAEEKALLFFHEGTRVKEITAGSRTYLYATSTVNNSQWLLIVKFDMDKALASFFEARRVERWIAFISSLVIVSCTLLIVNFLVNKIELSDRIKATYDEQMLQTDKMAAIGQLAAGVAHEVNNPLAVINEKAGWMQDLLTEEDPSGIKNYPEYEDAVKKIQLHVERARKITHRLLGYSRQVREVKVINIVDLVKETSLFLEKELLYHKIKLTTEFHGYIPAIAINSSEIQQVFLNIMNNSIDAIGTDGTIRISVSSDSEQIVINFSDTGPGIPADVINKIFDPFFTTKKVGKGTGLGLSVSYNIIKKMGGDIKVQSKPGEGTVFTILLSLKQYRSAMNLIKN